jgi:hypothetical protein
MKHILSVLAIVIVSVLTVGAQIKPVSVYVFAKPSPFMDEESKGRADALADVVKSLSKKKALKVVTSPEAAQIQIEILGRAYEATGETGTSTYRRPQIAGGGVSSTTTQEKKNTVHAVLTVGEYQIPIMGRTGTVLWREAANNAADKIDKWVKDNRSTLD